MAAKPTVAQTRTKRTQERPPAGQLLSISGSARYLGVSRDTFWNVRRRDETFPPPVQIPGVNTPRYRRADLEAWVAGLQPEVRA